MCSCEDCNGQLVCLGCITSIRNGHSFHISDSARRQRDLIQTFINKVDCHGLPKVDGDLTRIDKQKLQNSENVRKVIDNPFELAFLRHDLSAVVNNGCCV